MNRADRRHPILDCGDIAADMKAWQWLYAHRLGTSLVCATIWRKYGLCCCGRCDVAGGER